MSNLAAQELQSFVRRIESLDDEIRALNADKSEVFKEVKSSGFTAKTLRKVVAARRMDAAEREEADEEFHLYWSAVHGVEIDHVRAHVDNIEEFDAEPGEIQSDIGQPISNKLPPASRGNAGEDDLREPAATVRGQIAQEGDAPLEVSANAADEGMPVHAAHLSTDTEDPTRTPAGVVVTIANGVTGGESAATKPRYAEPGVVTTEHTPPEPVQRHPISFAFGELGQDGEAMRKAIHARHGGVAEPIVKIGSSILDGWGRYNISRALFIDYPVVQYAGTDLLADAVRWNLASRKLTPAQLNAVSAKLVKLYPDREQEILGMFDAEIAEAAE